MKSRFKPLWTMCFLFLTLMVSHCWDPEHKNPIDPENPDTHGKVIITIIDPKNWGNVGDDHTVKGSVSPRAEVTVFVHPLDANEYYVQDFPVVQDDGTWRTRCYFGQQEGRYYEVFAITPKKELTVGEVLYSLPEYTNISNVDTVSKWP